MTINNTLSWNNHTDSITKKLSKACYTIRNIKMHVCFIIKNDSSCLFSLSNELWNYILGKLVIQHHDF